MRKLNKAQNRFLEKVVACVAREVGQKEALRAVDMSAFIEILEEDPAFAMYYAPDYWAREILKRAKIAV